MSSSPRGLCRVLSVITGLVLLSGCTAGAGEQAAAPTDGAVAPDAVGVTDAATTAEQTAGQTTGSATPPVGAITDPDAPVATDDSRPSATGVVLSYAYWDERSDAVLASGYVSPHVEEGGTCTLVLTRDDEEVTARTAGLADASTTSCPEMSVPGADLRSGDWAAVLRYRSPSGSGTSQPLDVEVPR
ncbi:hypothetical protein [Modestobacter sp. SYSU DS0511]